MRDSRVVQLFRSEAMSRGRKPRSILVVHNAFSSFVQIDCELLSKHFVVTIQHEASPTQLRWTKTWREVKRHDLVYCWFASWHSILPVLAARLQGKPSVVVVGGYDTADMPEVRYGSQRGGLRKILARLVMSQATALIANSNSARLETIGNAGVPDGKITVIYHGVPSDPGPARDRRAPMALTVGGVCRENMLRKGILPFVQSARLLPDVRFVHVGAWQDTSIMELRKASASNLEFRGFISDQSLKELYDQASVYVQASLHEGFGMSVAEAMAAGCIPVVTRCGSLPEVVGDAGVYVPSQRPEAIADGIVAALRVPYEARLGAQNRIRALFTLSQREEGLKRLLNALMLPVPTCTESTSRASAVRN
jgi:glycosyltransferase involved in cell wall biosynthesis